MYILAIANNKGGVGKTTAAQNIGAAIENFSDKKTLMVDLDPQGNLSNSFGVHLEPEDFHVGHFLLGKVSLKDIVKTYKQTKIDILPASMDLIKQEDNLKNFSAYPFTLKRLLAENKSCYDFVVIDCPPALGTLTTLGLVACNLYYIPIQPEYFSYQGLKNFIHYVKEIHAINPSIKLGGVFANRFNPYSKKNYSKNIIEAVKDQLQAKFLKNYIRENITITEAQAKGEHIFDYDIKSNAAKDYYALTREIFGQ